VAELQRTLQDLAATAGSVPLRDALQQAVDAAARLQPAVGSGVMIADGEHVLRYVAASDGHGRELERIQEHTGTGPCVEALVMGEVVVTPDASSDPRWPEIHASLQDTRVRAVIGLPLHVGGAVVGSLDVYRDRAQPWSEPEREALVAYAALVDRLLIAALQAERHERTVQQLEYALEHRIKIERAVGMLMERDGVDAVDAFQRLRKQARDGRRRVVEIADELLARTAATGCRSAGACRPALRSPRRAPPAARRRGPRRPRRRSRPPATAPARRRRAPRSARGRRR
jgi:GAF domain-containing protein